MNDLINHLSQDIQNFAGDFTHVESVLYRQGNLIRRSRTGVETVIPLGIGIETDPTVPGFVKAITSTQISNWDTAFSWGNHAIQGYLTQAVANTLYASISHTHTFAQITSKPTTLSGYGITDPVVLTSNSYSNPSWITSLSWSKITGAPAFITGSGTTNYVTKWSGSSLVDSIIFENGGVGINTNSVSSQTFLHVVGTSTRSKSLLLDSTWSYQTSFSMRNGIYSTEFNLGGSTKSSNEGGPGSLQVSTYNSTTGTYRYPVTFYANGNVAFAGALGSVPADNGSTLQVNGTIQQSSVTSSLLKASASGVLVAAVPGVDYLVSVTTPTLATVTTAGNTTTNAVIVGGLTVATNLIYTDTVNGRVGIGTTFPYDKLEVSGAISATGSASANSAQAHATILSVESGISYLYAVDWGVEYKPLQVRAQTISLQTGGGSTTDRLFINSTGNVGIGTTNPAYKLQVQGSVYFNGTTNDFYVDGVSRFGGANSYSTVINNVGDVGIGVTPTAKLQVAGLSIFTNSGGSNYNENIRLPEATAGWSSIVMGGAIATSGTGTTVWSLLKNPSANGHRFSIRNNATDYLTIFTNGNVALGTTTDAGYKLDVNGTVRVQNIPAGTANYNRFLVSDSGVVKYRVASEMLSDIDVPGYVSSRGENLVTNGTGLRKSNYNFSAFTFVGSEAYYSTGSFRDTTFNSSPVTDEAIPVDVNQRYRLSVSARQNPYVGARYYVGVSLIDADGLSIQAPNHMYKANTLTTLAAPLNPGDTVMYLTSAANWENGGTAGVNTHLRSIILWNYVNSLGYAFPALTYSRNWYNNMWDPGSVNTTTNTITLRVPWAGSVIAAGTQLSNGSSGGTYKYITVSNVQIPNSWTNYTGTIEGVDTTGTNVTDKFAPGTAAIKILFLNNRDVAGATVYYTNVQFGLDLVNANTHILNQSAIVQTANFNISGNGYIGGRLGVGTTNPTRKLTVIDTTSAAGIAIDSSTQADNYYISASKAGSSRFSIYENSDVIYLNSFNRMHFRANLLGGSGGFFAFTGGNVTIGSSTNAGYALDVNGTTRLQGSTIISVSGTAGTSNDLVIYSTSDTTTNYQRGRLFVSGNIVTLLSDWGGTSNSADLGLYAGISGRGITVRRDGGSLGHIQFQVAGNSAAGSKGILFNNLTMSGASGIQYGMDFTGTVNQSSTAGYSIIRASIYEQAIGSGQRYLLDIGTNTLGTGLGTHTSLFSVSGNGSISSTGSITASTGVARGTYLNQTLVAAANNDSLVALDINPTFTVGAFTGVISSAIRFPNQTYITTANTTGSFYNVFGTDSNGTLRVGHIGLNTAFFGANMSLTGNSVVRFVSNGGTNFVYVYTGTTGNVVLQNGGTFTDAGYRLDVNGTARVNGNITISNNGNLVTSNQFYGLATNYANGIFAGWDVSAVYLGYSMGALPIHIGTNNTGDVRIKTNGNTVVENGALLVGTTTASGYKFDVNGQSRFSDHVVINTDASLFSGSPYNGYKMLGVGSSIGGGISFVSSNGIAAEIFGDNTPTGLYLASYGAAPVITFYINTTEVAKYTTAGQFQVHNLAGTGTRMVVADANGILSVQAIPSFTETDTLDSVTDRGATTSNSIQVGQLVSTGLIVSSGAMYSNVGYFSNSNGNLRYTFDNNDLVLRAGTSTSNEYVRVFGATGNMSIGSVTDAGYKLDVKGSTRVETLTVTSATYPSFPLYIQHIGNANQRITGGYGSEIIEFGEYGNTISIKANVLYLTAPQTAIGGNVIWSSGASFTQSYFLPAGNNRAVVFSSNYTNSGAGGSWEGSHIVSEANVATSISVTSVTINQFVSSPTVNVTNGTTVLRGFYHNPTLTSAVGLTNYAFESTSGKIKVSDLSGTGTRMVVADANGVLSTQAIPSGGGGGVTSVGITLGTSGTDVNVSNSPITSSGNITLNIPSASETARGLITTANQVFAGKKTFKASSLVVDTTNTSALIEGKVNGVDHGYIYFGQYFQFTATASAISGFLWKIGDGTNAMELLQDGKLRFNKYGVNTFSGIPATSLGVDGNGYLVEYTPVVQAENLTTMERTSLPGAQNGLIVYDTNMNKLYVKVPAGWEMIQSMP